MLLCVPSHARGRLETGDEQGRGEKSAMGNAHTPKYHTAMSHALSLSRETSVREPSSY